MAPRVPDEIDVFTVPHSRMKELVNIYTQKMQCVDFRDGSEVVSLLQDLDLTLYEFKSHESIENIFIMDQLKNRLKQHQIQNTAVCDCHNDNRLAEMLRLVRTGTEVNERSIGERLRFGCELQEAFKEFVGNFLPHMEEEEEVFQPLLVKYFEYEELKILKQIVLKEHELVKERQSQEKAQEEEPETNRDLKVLRDLNLDLCSLTENYQEVNLCSKIEEGCCDYEYTLPTYELPLFEQCVTEPESSLSLPTEILLEIFSYLSPSDLGKCAQVCWAWNNAAFSPTLWKTVFPVQWARGIWEWHDVGLTLALEDAASYKLSRNLGKWDEDADVDESVEERDLQAEKECFVMESLVKWVLPRVGSAVSTLVLDTGRGITSRLLHNALLLCPSIVKLSAAHTQIDYYSFKGLWFQGALQKLKHLDLQGCELIDDSALECFAQCAQPAQCPMVKGSLYCPYDVNPFGARSGVCGSVFGSEGCRRSGSSCFSTDRGTCSPCNDLRNLPVEASWEKGSPLYNTKNIKKNKNSLKQVKGLNARLEHFPSNEDTSGPFFGYLKGNEQDIEEICCYIGNYNSPGVMQTNFSCRKPEYETTSINSCNYWPERFSNDRNYDFNNGAVNMQLTSLNLSGCWRVTDEGLLALLDAGVVVEIAHLDVSGCFQLTGEALEIFTESCQSLHPEKLSYCDNITDGPYPNMANGCANLCNPVRVCCRNGR